MAKIKVIALKTVNKVDEVRGAANILCYSRGDVMEIEESELWNYPDVELEGKETKPATTQPAVDTELEDFEELETKDIKPAKPAKK